MTRLQIFIRVLLAAVLVTTARPSLAAVPVDVQLVLFTNIWKYDRNFDSNGVVTLVIIYQAGYRDSLLVKDDVVATVARLKLRIHCVPVEAGSPELLRIGLTQARGVVVYVTPLRAADLEVIVQISRERGLHTITGVPEYVEKGIAVGIGERKDHPLIIINLRAARAEGSAFNAYLLNLARIVGPAS